MVSVNRIKYANFSSVDFQVTVDLAIDSDDGNTNTYLTREAVSSETYNGKSNRVYAYKYNEMMTPTFTFLKEDCSDFTMEEVRKMLSWLTSEDDATFVSVYHDDSDVITYELLGNFTTIETYKLGNGRVIGIVAQFECVAPWAFSPLQIVSSSIIGTMNNDITITINSDDTKNPVMPKLIVGQSVSSTVVEVDHAYTDQDNWLPHTVFHYSDGGKYYWIDDAGTKHISDANTSGITTSCFIVKNKYKINEEEKEFSMYVTNNGAGEIVTVDGANRLIYSNSQNRRIFGNDFSWDWLPLFNGENNLTIIGNCQFRLEYREIRKVGEY